MAELSGLLLVVVILALLFDFSNGWHDSANAIATVVSTQGGESVHGGVGGGCAERGRSVHVDGGGQDGRNRDCRSAIGYPGGGGVGAGRRDRVEFDSPCCWAFRPVPPMHSSEGWSAPRSLTAGRRPSNFPGCEPCWRRWSCRHFLVSPSGSS